MQRIYLVALLAFGLLPGCATYQYAKNVKMVSYEDNVTVGKSVGPIRGESCQQRVMAVMKAQRQSGAEYIADVTISQKGSCVMVEGIAMK